MTLGVTLLIEQDRPLTGRPKVKVQVTQSCPTLFHPVDYTVHGNL